uniref:RING-type domain-containing protein n=1 Tax=Ficedula albicollis TaxID=59894 RepID=A0A803V7R3_FICAL
MHSHRLVAETTCPLCVELFSQPVLAACGHSFCQQCASAVLGDPPRPAACPLCRSPLQPGSLRPSRSLGAVAELARSMGELARARCPRHGSLMVLFCQPCAAPLCASCCSGLQHRSHRVLLAEEAARELRVRPGGLGRGTGTGKGPLWAHVHVLSGHTAALPAGTLWVPSRSPPHAA